MSRTYRSRLFYRSVCPRNKDDLRGSPYAPVYLDQVGVGGAIETWLDTDQTNADWFDWLFFNEDGAFERGFESFVSLYGIEPTDPIYDEAATVQDTEAQYVSYDSHEPIRATIDPEEPGFGERLRFLEQLFRRFGEPFPLWLVQMIVDSQPGGVRHDEHYFVYYVGERY